MKAMRSYMWNNGFVRVFRGAEFPGIWTDVTQTKLCQHGENQSYGVITRKY